PLGRDSLFLDPARISLAPLERIDVVVLPASLRVYLVTLRQRSTETASQVGVATGEVKTANYRGAFLRRWHSGLGLSLVADYNDNQGIGETSSAPFSSVDLWLKAEYVPSARFGVAYQTLSSRWHRSEAARIADWHPQRRDGIFRVFAAARDDGVGLRAQATFATTHVSRDTAVPDRSLSQSALEVTNDWSRAHIGLAIRRMDQARPWQFAGSGAWTPFPGLTLAGDARRAEYGRWCAGETTSSHPTTRASRSPFIRSSGGCTGAGSSGCGVSWPWTRGAAGRRDSTRRARCAPCRGGASPR